MHGKTFDSLDFIIFALMLSISTGIGIFFGCFGKKQETTRDLLIADRGMGVIPVSMSLFASYISGASLLGSPLDVYNNDLMFIWSILGYAFCTILTSYIFVPFFIELGHTSAYEYLGKRFDRKVKLLATLVFIFNTIFYLSFVLYGSAVAIKEATNTNIWVLLITIGVVSTFYTTVGGMVTVMWTDVFQVTVIFLGLFTIAIVGANKAEGLNNILEINWKYKRINLFNLSLNPKERHTVWSLSIGCAVQWLGIFGCNQLQVQRYLCASSLKVARKALYYNLLAYALLICINMIIGMIIFAFYKGCNILNGASGEHLVPRFVMDSMSDIPGLPGLFLSALFAAVLSTISSGLNSLAAVTLEDLVKIFVKSKILETKFVHISRALCILFGILVTILTLVAHTLQNTLQASLSLFSATFGPILAMFILGIYVKKASSNGVFYGGLLSLTFSLYMFIVGNTFNSLSRINDFNKDNCTYNVSANGSSKAKNSPFIIPIGYQWHGLLSFSISIICSLIISFTIGLFKKYKSINYKEYFSKIHCEIKT